MSLPSTSIKSLCCQCLQNELMIYIRSMTVRSQSRKMDISKVFCHVKTLESTLAMIRDKVDCYNVQWYKEGVSAAVKCNVLPEHKRKHLHLN